MSDNDAWAQAMEEAQSVGQRDKGLWARCFAEADGDEGKAQAAYVKARVKTSAPVQPAAPQREGYCPNCGAECRMEAPFCSKCKAVFDATGWRPVAERPSSAQAMQSAAPRLVKSAKSRGIYIVLGLFFGMLGIHNFYAGRLGIGLAQLLVTCILGWFVVGLFITGLWVLIELFVVKKDGAGDAFA
jgi:TM2 domain-containing membrane protein YozV